MYDSHNLRHHPESISEVGQDWPFLNCSRDRQPIRRRECILHWRRARIRECHVKAFRFQVHLACWGQSVNRCAENAPERGWRDTKREPFIGNATQNVYRCAEIHARGAGRSSISVQSVNRSAEMRRKTLTVRQKRTRNVSSRAFGARPRSPETPWGAPTKRTLASTLPGKMQEPSS